MDKATIEAMRRVVGECSLRADLARQAGNANVDMTGNSWMPTAEFRLAVEGFRTLVDEAAAEQGEGDGVDKRDEVDGVKAVWDLLYAVSQCVTSMGNMGSERIRIQGRGYSYEMYAHKAASAIQAIKAMLAAKPTEQPQPQAEPDDRDVLTRFVEDLEDAVIEASKHETHRVIIAANYYSRSWTQAEISNVIGAINGLLNAKPTPPVTDAEPTDEECLAAMNRNKHKGSDRWKMVVKKHVYLTGVQTLDADEFTGLGRLLIERERAAKGGA